MVVVVLVMLRLLNNIVSRTSSKTEVSHVNNVTQKGKKNTKRKLIPPKNNESVDHRGGSDSVEMASPQCCTWSVDVSYTLPQQTMCQLVPSFDSLRGEGLLSLRRPAGRQFGAAADEDMNCDKQRMLSYTLFCVTANFACQPCSLIWLDE